MHRSETYFYSHYDEIHPSYMGEPGSSHDPKVVFERQLSTQPGVVLRVRVLRLREYSEQRIRSGDHLRWETPWQRQLSKKERFFYLRQPTSSCDTIKLGAKLQVIWAPQCCDTGYHGEIGCNLDLGMVQELPATLASAS